MVDIKTHPLAFVYRIWSPVITLNGYRVHGRWGPNALPLPAGHHHLAVHIPYLLPPEIGRAELTVPVEPGRQVHLEYRAPMGAFMRGALGPPPQKWPGLVLMYVFLGVILLLTVLLTVVLVAATASGG
ncbi:hypothetical protein E1200_00880 [Actinomadura sp. GC306]|uniref:hypothetical protein n=1 Tax=Actinomadura sp. GC306 TaxID=2530367 RepID=UPI001051D891|nr:hypothetical protein [Actinomadura sp. GC306]TDC71795.1 hypothetical protein E1200_00880 [Actinomadura sp. GC306]